MKRAFDFFASLVGLLVLSPLFVLTAIAIKLFDGGSVLFGQIRMGLKGRPFRMWKFRSMRPSTGGPEITVGADSRITPVGRILRKSKLDELPQLFNVLAGQMSLVGPRPEVERYTRQYTKEQAAVLDLVPGITDPASFAFYDESQLLAESENPEDFYVRVLMAEKIRINLEYARKRTFATDLLVILFTVLRPAGVRMDLFSRIGIREPQLGTK